MSTLDIQTITKKAAQQDMARARRDAKRAQQNIGTVTVVGTKRGNVDINYNVSTDTYSLTLCGVWGAPAEELASGSSRVVTPVLASLYHVVVR